MIFIVNAAFLFSQDDSTCQTFKVRKIYWEPLNSGTDIDLFSVYFFDESTGNIVGLNRKTLKGIIMRTIDGGANWTVIDSNITTYEDSNTFYYAHMDLTSISVKVTNPYAFNYHTSFTVGGYGSKSIYESVYKFLYNSCRYSLYAVTNDGNKILKSSMSNYHSNYLWSVLYTDTSRNLNSVCFIDDNTGYAVGQNGAIIKTTNGGKKWVSQLSGTGFDLNAVYFINKNIGYAVGYNGTILKTINGGGIYK